MQTQIAAFDPADLADLGAVSIEVRYVSLISPPLTEVNNSVRSAMEVSAVNQAPYALTGAGSNVLVYDAGLVDRNHPDFGSRVTWGESGGIGSHGTHVAGTVGGSGQNSGGTYAGMAPATKITSYMYESCSPFCLYNSPQDIAENYEEGFRTYGAMFATNSLGANIATNGYDCDWEGDYELTAQLLDAIAVGETFGAPFLSLWAAGNERQTTRCGNQYYTTGVPATAKNPIVVGATNSNDRSMTWFSSWGPVDDGRLRPDVCGPGCQTNDDGGVTSTVPGSGYGVSCGTSMATPAVAGVVALLREQGQSIWTFSPPRPSMVKALVVNTARDLGNPGPDYQFGFGEVHATELMDHLRNDYLRIAASIAQDQERVYEVDVQGLSVLKASIAWDDVPGELLAAKELVNDLDLQLESPSGALHDPWLLDPANPANNATLGADHINNVEQVLVDSPEDGIWKLHVRGFLVPDGPQSFSLVANAVQLASTDA
ncbi:MAG: S8 family serine peptidase [Candidatus Eisenbacteria bacterium]